jgi:hypothetical protein
MDVTWWTRVVGFLLPKSRAFRIDVPGKKLYGFATGIGAVLKIVHDFLSEIFLDLIPRTTTKALLWSQHFGYPQAVSSTALEAEWADGGGQSPETIQNRLQAAGFNVWVHEWWQAGVSPVTARNPIPYIDVLYSIDATHFQSGSNLLVNRQEEALKNYAVQCGDGTQCEPYRGDGEDVQCGEWNGLFLYERGYVVEDDADLYPFYWYVCGETWPDAAFVSDSQLDELKRLIYKFKPIHTRVVLIVDTTHEIWLDTIGGSPIMLDTLGGSPIVEDTM